MWSHTRADALKCGSLRTMDPSPGAPFAVELDAVSKRYGGAGESAAVDGLNLAIRDGEFFSLLGPSGSGKTTTLRMIAGFERPTSGTIRLYGRDVTELPPNEREVNTVFQDYALFPHMSVAQNIAYGLEVRRVPKEQHAEQVREVLRMVRLEGYDDRKPAQLSGGQRQRVALARALVNRPRVLLLDEPLGALDLKLREEMQGELKAIQGLVGITFVYVTHDQQEALSMSDRIAVFNRGRIEQVGTPMEVYQRPANLFVAGFVGASNVVSGALAQRLLGSSAQRAMRPEQIRIVSTEETPRPGEQQVHGTIATAVYLGAETRYTIAVEGGGDLVVVQQNLHGAGSSLHRSAGERVQLAWRTEDVLDLAETPSAARE